MTQIEQAKLDAICAEAFERLNALDEKLYQRGFIGKPQNAWWRPKLPEPQGEPGKAKGLDGGESITNPHPAPTRPPRGDANVLQAIRAMQR